MIENMNISIEQHRITVLDKDRRYITERTGNAEGCIQTTVIVIPDNCKVVVALHIRSADNYYATVRQHADTGAFIVTTKVSEHITRTGTKAVIERAVCVKANQRDVVTGTTVIACQ